MRISVLLFLITPLLGLAQADSLKITVYGHVYTNDANRSYYDLMVVNKRTHSGIFGNADGSFSLTAQRGDTLLFGTIGMETRHVAVPDTVKNDSLLIVVKLQRLEVALRPVEVLPERTLKEIHAEISELGYDPNDYKVSGVNALESPITFLYQTFSKRERSKRKVAELENEERKRDLLKALLTKYVEYDIINLSNESFDEFIDFVQVPDHTLQSMSQYDFLMYIKRRYELYSRLGPTRRY